MQRDGVTGESLLATAIEKVATSFISDLVEGKIYSFENFVDVDNPNARSGSLKLLSCATDRFATAETYIRVVAIIGILAKLESENRVISQRDLYYTLKVKTYFSRIQTFLWILTLPVD